jgi:hypothetical protein
MMMICKRIATVDQRREGRMDAGNQSMLIHLCSQGTKFPISSGIGVVGTLCLLPQRHVRL